LFIAWRHRVLFVAAGLLAGVVIAECAVRAVALAPTAVVATADTEAFARVPGVYAPSRRWDGLGRRHLPFSATINSLGYRGVEPRADATAALRVLFVGDSFVFGDFVRDDETWPAQVEAALDCRRPVVVYNAGIRGASLPEAVMMVERGGSLAPHAVVAAFTASNDVKDLVYPSVSSVLEAKRRDGYWRDAASRMLARSGLWNLVSVARARWVAQQRAAVTPAAVSDAEHRYAQLLGTWVSRLRHAGTPLIFVAYPSYPMLAARDRTTIDWVLGVAREAGLDPVDLWPALARPGHATQAMFLIPHDGHPSPAGHAVAARVVAAALRDRIPGFRDCRVR
jgi:GDSL-like Lipase/Acylhydrolase family